MPPGDPAPEKTTVCSVPPNVHVTCPPRAMTTLLGEKTSPEVVETLDWNGSVPDTAVATVAVRVTLPMVNETLIVVDPCAIPSTVPDPSTSAMAALVEENTGVPGFTITAPAASKADTVIVCVLPASRLSDAGLVDIEPSVWLFGGGGGGGGGFVPPSSPPPPPQPSSTDVTTRQAKRVTRICVPPGIVRNRVRHVDGHHR